MFLSGIVLALVRLLDDDNAITRQQTALCLARIATGLDNDDQFKIHLRYFKPKIQCLAVSVSLWLHAFSPSLFLLSRHFSSLISILTYSLYLHCFASSCFLSLSSPISHLPFHSPIFFFSSLSHLLLLFFSPTYYSPLLSYLFLPSPNNFPPLFLLLFLLPQPNIQSCSLEAGTIENVRTYMNIILYLNNNAT